MVKKIVSLFVGILSLFFFALFVGNFSSVYASEGNAVWAKSSVTGTVSSPLYSGVSVDSSGNAYAVGSIDGTAHDFGNSITVAGAGSSTNGVIVKYNSSGLAQWARSTTTAPDESNFKSVSVDTSGNTYAVGYIYGTGTYDFGNSITVAGGHTANNSVIVKYNSSGLAQWAKSTTTGPNTSEFSGVTVDTSGNTYAAGYITGTGTYNFGNSVTVAGNNGQRNLVIVQYNSSGIAQWAKSTVTGPASSEFESVSVDTSGNTYAAGYITGTGTYNLGNSITVAGASAVTHIVIVKYNSSGLAQWARSTTTAPEESVFSGVFTDSSGNSYAVGRVTSSGTFNFGNGVTVAGANIGDYNSLIVKYDSSGLAQWAKSTTTGPNISEFSGVSVDTSGNTYAAGYIYGSGTYNFGSSITVAGAGVDVYNPVIVKYDSSGLAQWAKSTVTGTVDSLYSGVSVDSSGNAYAVGYITDTGTYNFGSSITVAGAYAEQNMVIVKYQETVAATPAPNTSGLSSSSSNGCNNQPPVSTPDLFQIDTKGTSATLFFTPIGNTNEFFISYSTNPLAEQHGVGISLGNVGVQNFTINLLNPNSKYYFKVRGQNGCMPGNWSTILSAKSKSIGNSTIYKNYKY